MTKIVPNAKLLGMKSTGLTGSMEEGDSRMQADIRFPFLSAAKPSGPRTAKVFVGGGGVCVCLGGWGVSSLSKQTVRVYCLLNFGFINSLQGRIHTSQQPHRPPSAYEFPLGWDPALLRCLPSSNL